ncbi:MAG: T9SS type A sorting domain-containing protein, partial [Candidatus Zixiibacteriota bacterium]
ITGQPVSSPVSDKVTIIFSHHVEGDLIETVGDVLYVESQNGVDWDWSQRVNITNYALPDTFRAWLDLDAIYDYSDQLHIIWNTLLYEPETGLGYVASILWHWSLATGIRAIADGMWDSNPGSANLTVSKPSIGVDEDNNLFVIWTQFTLDDVSIGGYSNGELYGSASIDGGLTWGRRVNMTESPTPDCWPGECDSDHWSSMAEIVDTTLHILYINDKDAGAVVRDPPEGVDTENPVLYLTFPADRLLQMASAEDHQTSIPDNFVLRQNYPNPFNSRTAIEFETKASGKVELSIYNLRGDKVGTLVNDILPARRYSANWEAEKVASGVYFYKLTSSGETQSKRMLLLK